MRSETREKILQEVVKFARSKLQLDVDVERLKRAFPFHAPFFTDEGLRAFKNQRSIVTGMGQRLIPRIAEIIASDLYADVHRDYAIEGNCDEGMILKIREIVSELRVGARMPNSQQEWHEVLESRSSNLIRQQVIADLYIGDFTDGPLFMEIKSPRPNLDVCAETKLKMLIFRAIMYQEGRPQARAYFGLWYNPDIERTKYSHHFTRRIMDMDREVLIGEELWDTIGGPGTYNELLEVLEQAGKMVRQR